MTTAIRTTIMDEKTDEKTDEKSKHEISYFMYENIEEHRRTIIP